MKKDPIKVIVTSAPLKISTGLVTSDDEFTAAKLITDQGVAAIRREGSLTLASLIKDMPPTLAGDLPVQDLKSGKATTIDLADVVSDLESIEFAGFEDPDLADKVEISTTGTVLTVKLKKDAADLPDKFNGGVILKLKNGSRYGSENLLINFQFEKEKASWLKTALYAVGALGAMLTLDRLQTEVRGKDKTHTRRFGEWVGKKLSCLALPCAPGKDFQAPDALDPEIGDRDVEADISAPITTDVDSDESREGEDPPPAYAEIYNV